jgi:hypothetical protein
MERSEMEAVTEIRSDVYTAADYVLSIPELDGHKADKMAIQFGGGLELDRTSTEDLDFVNNLTLGQEVTITVTAVVTRKGFSFAPGKEAYESSTGYGVTLKVESITG